MAEPSMIKPPLIFEYLIHLLEISVVLGIGVVIYITKKHPRKSVEEATDTSDKKVHVELEAPEAPAELAMFKQDKPL